MSRQHLRVKERTEPPAVSLPARNLQRACACGQHTHGEGECEACREKREALAREQLTRIHYPERGQGIGDRGREDGLLTEHSRGLRFGHNFSRVPAGDTARDLVELKTPGVYFHPRPDPRLHPNTPAWSEGGEVHLGPAGLWMPEGEREKMVRHEGVHSLQQRLAPAVEGPGPRQHAESLARRGQEGGSLPLSELARPAPGLLAFPVQTYQPWTRVWIGHAGLIGEVVEAGITVRIFRTYDELGLSHAKDYQCGKHDLKEIGVLVKQMKAMAQTASQMNANLPKTAAAQRTKYIFISGKASASRILKGEGVILVEESDFRRGKVEDTVAHEAAHGIFEHHSIRKGKPEKRVPDALALRIADLYVQLQATKEVPEPTGLFDEKKPPPLSGGGGSQHAAGVTMVMDTLWSGSGGHPWQGVDEFFASAYAGSIQNPKLLAKIIAHYSKADAKIKPLAKELLSLLAVVGKPAEVEKLSEPGDPKAAREALSSVSPTLDLEKVKTGWFEGRLNWLIDPDTMPSPDKLLCSSSTGEKGPKTEPDIDELLDFEKKKEGR